MQTLFIFTFEQTNVDMVIFNELRICEDGDYLKIDCQIDDAQVYENMYIKEIYLEYYKNASSASMPSSKAYKIYDNSNDDTTVRRRQQTVTKADLGWAEFGVSTFSDGLFYVIVKCDGVIGPEIANYPCGADSTTKIGVALDWKAVYRRGMGYIYGLLDPCGNPCPSTAEFEHFILLWNALKLAIASCDWDAVSDLWDKFLYNASSRKGSVSVATGGCGCRK